MPMMICMDREGMDHNREHRVIQIGLALFMCALTIFVSTTLVVSGKYVLAIITTLIGCYSIYDILHG